jgi:hypothetical protein
MIKGDKISNSGAFKMLDSGESQKEVIRPDFNRAIMIDFQGATIPPTPGSSCCVKWTSVSGSLTPCKIVWKI